MTTIVAGGQYAISTDAVNLPSLRSGTITQATGGVIVVSFGTGYYTEFHGSFGYDTVGNLTGGTLISIRDVAAGSDTLDGGSGANYIDGGSGSERTGRRCCPGDGGSASSPMTTLADVTAPHAQRRAILGRL